MDDEMQLWTVRAFDDASALVPLPPRERWIPKDVRPERTTPALMAGVADREWTMLERTSVRAELATCGVEAIGSELPSVVGLTEELAVPVPPSLKALTR